MTDATMPDQTGQSAGQQAARDPDSERVIMTGASSGIGQAIARMFCAEGARVANIDIADGSETARSCGSAFRSFAFDVAEPEQVAQAFSDVDAWFGAAPTVLVNVAAVFPNVAFLEMLPDTFDRVMAVNVRGPFLCSQQAARRMCHVQSGRIINITSTESVQAFALASAYGASKAALAHLTKGMAIELASHGITVNAVAPGAVETPPLLEWLEQNPEAAQHDLERTPLGRFGTPDDIVAAVRFLAKDATWMTGQTIYVDGGFLVAGLPVLPGSLDAAGGR